MRPSELAPAVIERLAALLRGRSRSLVVGRALDLSALGAEEAAGFAEARALGGRFDALIWSEPGGESLPELASVRALLEPAARLVIVNVVEPSALRRLRAFVAKERLDPVRLEDLCTELLLRGFIAPRLHPPLAGTRVVSAELPARSEPLDDFFAQPPPAVSR